MTASPSSLSSTNPQLLTQARRFVAQTFYGTLLKQMHNSPFRSEIFDGGRGGQAFSGMLDQALIDRMSRGAGGKLADSLVRSIQSKGAAHGHIDRRA